MPPLVFDFTDIASRLRKDDFYTPTPTEPVQVSIDLTEPDFDRTIPICPRCGSSQIELSIIPRKGNWWCNPCKDWFS